MNMLEDIKTTIAHFTWARDSGDWETLRHCLSKDLHYVTTIPGADTYTIQGAEDFIAMAQSNALSGSATAQHYESNVVVDVDGNTASVQSYQLRVLVSCIPDVPGVAMSGVKVHYKLQQTQDKWIITTCHVTPVWEQNTDLIETIASHIRQG